MLNYVIIGFIEIDKLGCSNILLEIDDVPMSTLCRDSDVDILQILSSRAFHLD
jgi:hypothetical protein